MTANPEMLCPRCGVALAARSSGHETVHGCRSCGGVWLDTARANALMTELSKSLALADASDQVANAAAAPGHARTDPAAATCPVGGEPLRVAVDQGVEVDVCGAHGTWFDAGEIRRVASAYRAANVRDAAAPQSTSELIAAFLGGLG